MRAGVMIPGSLPPVSEIWELAQANLRELPDTYKTLVNPPAYPVEHSPSLMALRDAVMRRHANGANGASDGQVMRDEHA
jgi:nicotinate phosphoribosyltransferase